MFCSEQSLQTSSTESANDLKLVVFKEIPPTWGIVIATIFTYITTIVVILSVLSVVCVMRQRDEKSVCLFGFLWHVFERLNGVLWLITLLDLSICLFYYRANAIVVTGWSLFKTSKGFSIEGQLLWLALLFLVRTIFIAWYMRYYREIARELHERDSQGKNKFYYPISSKN